MSPRFRRVAWRAIVAIAAVLAILIVALVGAFGSGYFKNYYMPAESMSPTLEKGDRFVAFLDGGSRLKRGEIVILKVGETAYVKRVAALAGDTIGLENGIVILNGRAVPQRLLGAYPGSPPARRLAEQFPGETAPHEILDTGPSEVDEFPVQRVPAGFVFVLGDDRDRSADSRVPRDQMGVELVPLADVRGHAFVATWPRAKMGRKLNP